MFARIINSLQNSFKIPELRQRLLFTLGMLAVYRIGVHVPTPGIDTKTLSDFLQKQGGALLGFLDMFAGGGLFKLSVFALGIMPYISASIILQLLTVVIPSLAKLAKEGEQGRRKITQYTRYGTVVISVIQSLGIAFGLESMSEGAFVQSPGWFFRLITVMTLTAGTAFIMWLGEQITERGIGNGISLVIFAGIVARLPRAIYDTYQLMAAGELSPVKIVILGIVIVFVIAAIIFLESGRRKIPVQYAKRVIGRKIYGGQSTHIPLRLNTAGVIPPIFASSIIAFPATAAGFINVPWVQAIARQLTPGALFYTIPYVLMIIFFAFFYTAVVFNPMDLAENLKKYGGFIPGIRPGQRTADYVYRVITRITTGGAIYLAIVCVLPEILRGYLNIPFYFGGTSLLIVVGVGLDTIQQIETHMITRHYEGFMKKGRIRGRSG